MNQKALQFLLANTQTHYLNFDPTTFKRVAFLPAIFPDGKQVLAKPGEASLLPYRRVNSTQAHSSGLFESKLRGTWLRSGGCRNLIIRKCSEASYTL